MTAPAFNETQALHQEIDRTPKEYHGTLLKMIQAFREGVSPNPAEVRFALAWKQAMEGDVVLLDSIWNELDKDD
jgi:hypothetical protein